MYQNRLMVRNCSSDDYQSTHKHHISLVQVLSQVATGRTRKSHLRPGACFPCCCSVNNGNVPVYLSLGSCSQNPVAENIPTLIILLCPKFNPSASHPPVFWGHAGREMQVRKCLEMSLASEARNSSYRLRQGSSCTAVPPVTNRDHPILHSMNPISQTSLCHVSHLDSK